MKLALQLGYWGADPIVDAPELIAAAEGSGFDAVFTAESWGSDAYTPLAWWGAATSRIRLGTAVAQLSARPPTSLAMHALTLDHLSGGRHIIGLGVSGPQVVEGWYGQPFGKPLARTREYVQIVRDVLSRADRVRSAGPHYPLPYPADAPGATGLGKSLKPITHPLRADIPIWLGAEGPKNVAQTAEIADGWLAIFYSLSLADQYESWLAEGFARPGARRTRDDFEVAATVQVVITDDVAAAVDAYRPATALYVGDRLGWFRSLAEDGPATAPELAARTGTAARYAREGAQALLIGEALVKNGDPQQGLADIITACADATNASAVEGTPA